MKRRSSSKELNKPGSSHPSSDDFLVVGISASAGGIEALKELSADIPAEPNMAFVVILHLSQRHKSNPAEIIQRETEMTVEQATEILRKVVHPALVSDLRAALFAARQEDKTVEAKNIRVKFDGDETTVNLAVRPVKMPDDAALVISEQAQELPNSEAPPQAIVVGDQAMETVIRRMEDELRRTKDQLRTTTEQYETSVEKLKVSNEELQAMNEELRSATEELETGKEDLQSVNEELTTVNRELKEKIEEISHANSDLQNLMRATDIATIFLDRDLKIKRYTPRATEIFNLIPADIGRPLAHITHSLAPDDFHKDAEKALNNLQMSEREVFSKENRIFLARFSPYRTIEDKIDGVVLSFVDITEQKQNELAIAGDLKSTQLLQDLSIKLFSEKNSQVIYNEILTAVIRLMQADAGTVQIFDEKTQELILLATEGFDQKMTDRFFRVNAHSSTSCGVALASGERTFLDFDDPEIKDPDGSMRMHIEAGYLSAQSTPLIARSGKPIGMLSTHWSRHHRPTARELSFLDLLARQAADLIDLRQSKKAIRDSETKYHTLFDSIDEGFALIEMIFDRDGKPFDFRFLETNRAFARHSGIEKAEGKTATEIDPQIEHSWIEAMGEVALSGEPARIENYNEFTNRWYSMHISRAGGENSKLLAIVFNDITRRKNYEQQLRRAAELNEFRVRLNDALRPLNDPFEIQAVAARAIGEQIKVSRVVSGSIDNGEITVYGAYVSDAEPVPDKFEFMELGAALDDERRRGRTIFIEDVETEERLSETGRDTLRSKNIAAFVETVHVRGDQPAAVFSLHSETPRRWTLDEIMLTEETAKLVWAAVEHGVIEERLRESEKRLRVATEAAEMFTWEADYQSGKMSWSENAARLIGCSEEDLPEEVLDGTFFVIEEDRERVRQEFQESVNAGKNRYISEFRSNMGQMKFWQTHSSIIYDAKGQLQRVVGITQNITAQKRSERALRESEERFRKIFEHAATGIAITNLSGQFQHCNPAYCKLTGYTVEELKEIEFYKLIHEDDREGNLAEIERLKREELPSFEIENRYVTKDGQPVWVHKFVSLLHDQAGAPAHLVALVTDVTERRRAEEALRESERRLQLILESVRDYAIFTFGTDGRITRWNTGAEKIFGYAEKEVIGQPVDIIFTPEDRKRKIPAEETKTALENGRAEDERWHIRKDGSRFFASGILTVLDEDNMQGFVKIVADLTEQRDLTEELRRSREELEIRVKERTRELAEANKNLEIENRERQKAEKERISLLKKLVTSQEDERRRIARDLHDHLGQLMTALRLQLESLKVICGDNDLLGEKVEETKKIAEQADTAVGFIAWELRPTALDDLGLREALVNYVRQWSDHTGITAEIHVGSFEKRLSKEAEINLYRIAQEALNNVSKHSQAEHVSVLLEQRDQHAVLIIEDTGIGFDAVNQSERAGMGLIGMRERTLIIGGAMEIESAPDAGTTIFVRVPFRLSENDAGKELN